MNSPPEFEQFAQSACSISRHHAEAERQKGLNLIDLGSARDPEFEACRALLAKGITGTLLTYSPGSSVPRMKVDIEKGAKLATIDNANDGPRLGRYRPHPNGGKADDAD
jgi:hypothetical protein